MHRLFYLSAWVGILSAIIMVLIVGFWLVYPYKTIEFKSTPEVTSKNSYQRGTPVTYTAEYCKYTDVSPEITIQFVDGIVFTLPEHTSSPSPMGCGLKVVQIIIPETLPAGEYQILTTHRYEVNPIRNIYVRAQTNKFTVTE